MLRLENLSCGYGPFTAVHGLDIDLAKASVQALIGPNGAGKSSTIMAIAGHVTVKQGSISLDGNDITGMPARERVAEGIAVAPEGRRLFPDLSVKENLIVGGYSRAKSKTPGNIDRVLSLFPRLQERFGQMAGSLSGGEQQMLAIGRALMAEPRLLLIDEVSLGLMPKMVDICYSAISKLRGEGMTILLVEQSTSRALAIADQVCVMESGRRVWSGSGEDARRDPTLIDAYLGVSGGEAA
tara:strand:- start:116 stop:835 length:720 start_codon:yes stop_codon:yes gene_type:complete